MSNREESCQKVSITAEMQLPGFIFYAVSCREGLIFCVPNILSLCLTLQAYNGVYFNESGVDPCGLQRASVRSMLRIGSICNFSVNQSLICFFVDNKIKFYY